MISHLVNRHSVFALVLALAATTAASSARADLWGFSVDPFSTAPEELADQYNRVFRFDTLGNKIGPDIASGSAGLNYPTGMAVSPDGRVFVSSLNIGSILVFDGETGQPLSINGGPDGFFTSLSEPSAAPAQLAFGPDGNLYVSEFFGTAVRVYDPATAERLPDAATGLTAASGLAFGPDGALYVGDGFIMSAEDDPARIVRVHEGEQSTYGISDMGMLSSPTSLLFLQNGDLLVADVLGNYVARFDAGGFGFAPFAIIPPEIPDPLPDGVAVESNNPSGLAFDQDGNVLVSVLGLTAPPDERGAILRYALDGTPLEPLAENLQLIGGLAWTKSLKTLSGDFDGDNEVGPDDYTKWKATFSRWVAAGNGADGNGDGVIDAADYTVWRDRAPLANAPEPEAASAVPEPASAALLLLGAVASLAATMRRRA